MNDKREEYLQHISTAAMSLKSGDLQQAQQLINNTLLLDPDAPEAQNMLGILSELRGDDGIARKHYRAAYALDPTYKPASKNLERLCRFAWDLQNREFDYGEISTTAQEETQNAVI